MTNPTLEPPVPCPNADPASASPILMAGDGAAAAPGPMLSANDHFDWLRGYCHSASAPAGSEERLALVGQGRAHAVAFHGRVAEALDWTVGDTARYLGITPRTLHRWQHDMVLVATLGLRTPGRPQAAATASERSQVIDFLKAEGPGTGVPRLETHFAETDIARAEMRRLLAEFRRHWRQGNQRLIHVCRWQVPGTVWAMDFTEMPVPIDGRFPHALAIRDLASGYQLLWQPVLRQTAQPVLEALIRLFTIHGAPLVLKSDNGSAFLDAKVRKFLDRWQVFPLYSPPRTPQYNGACEASIGSLKRRTQRQVEVRTALSSEPGTDPTWTSNDLDTAQEQANAEPNGRRPGPSRAQVWEARAPVTAEQRAGFGEVYRREEEHARREKQHPDGPLTRSQQAAVDRIALRRAMLARDYLEFRRRRISPPIPRKKCDTTG